jgi:hypothetical protein
MQESRNERSERANDVDGVVVYVRGPGWPTTVNVDNGPANPWSRKDWNLTGQARIIKRDQAEAERLAQAAGHKDPISARFEKAK